MENHQLVLVLDFGGQYNQLIARRVREHNVYCEVKPYKTSIEEIKALNPIGIIFTGGPNSVYEEKSPKCDPALFELGVPVLGICYGMQLTAYTLGGTVERAAQREYGRIPVDFDVNSPLFAGMKAQSVAWMSHTFHVTRAPEGFTSIAHSENCAFCAMANPEKRIYAVQFHPEVTHSEEGQKVIANFLYNVCGCTGDWTMSTFIDNAIASIREQVGPNGRVMLGLSGGADSVCLFHLLRELQEPLGFSLLAVHVNHNLRGAEAGRDAAFAENLCREYDVPFYLYSCPVEKIAKEKHLSTEEAGRAARQEVFAACAKEQRAVKIALAHHQDDVAETMLHHLARGTSLTGLASLRPVRGNVIRPLLCVGRKEIRQELESRKCSWCEDSTNAEDAYTRNGIRHHVLPYLTEEVNPRAAAHMAQTSLDLLETEEYLEQQTDQLMERYASAEKNAVVLRDAVSSEAPLLQRYVIRRVLEQLAGKRKDLTREHLESVRELFEKQVGKSVCLPYGITAVRGYETLRLEKQGIHLKEERKRKSGEEVPIPVPAGWEEEKSLAFAENPVTIVKKTSVFPERIEEKKYTKCFDCDKIKDGLVLRTRRSGDYLRVTAKGGKKKLKDYMIDAKIPKEERDSILLLADGPEIWWVVGYRRGESGRVGEDTKAVLQIQIGVGKEENR